MLCLDQIGFCGNGKCMCELGEFDETSKIQKKYNLLSWYLMAAIIFYAIPAYQLVTTYQQVLAMLRSSAMSVLLVVLVMFLLVAVDCKWQP